MSRKRMFTLDVVDQPQFLDMPATSRCLYYELGMRADDDGFIGNISRLLAWLNASPDDLRILVAKGYLIEFESGVIVITDWLQHNTLKGDRYHPTVYDEKTLLTINTKKSYVLISGTILEPQIRKVKNRITTTTLDSSSKDDCEPLTVQNVDKSIVDEVLRNLPANSKERKKIIAKYGGVVND